jgi:pimeloyl-ACP methyl ester carboxylesterase
VRDVRTELLDLGPEERRELDLGDGATELFLGTDPKNRPDTDPGQLPAPKIPTVIVQGDRDVVVRPAVAEAYVAKHPSVRLVRLGGVGHFAVIDPLSAVWPTILDELAGLAAKVPVDRD